MRGKGSEEIRTVAVAVMRRDFLSDRYWLDDTECYVASLTEELTIVVAVVLS
jgi:hypothetical protein